MTVTMTTRITTNGKIATGAGTDTPSIFKVNTKTSTTGETITQTTVEREKKTTSTLNEEHSYESDYKSLNSRTLIVITQSIQWTLHGFNIHLKER